MAGDREDFLRRWSRRKQAAAAPVAAPAPQAADAAPALPPLDSLTFESDFKDFMHAKVEESVKRAALKKLFADPRFNVIDFMDVYIDDYTNLETIPPDMLAKLEHAKSTLLSRESPSAPGPEEAGRQANTEDPKSAQAQPDTPSASRPEKADDGAAG